jgi:hypothetical protein
MTRSGAIRLCVAVIRQWLRDGCPSIDLDMLDNMLAIINDEKLTDEVKRRQSDWSASSSR